MKVRFTKDTKDNRISIKCIDCKQTDIRRTNKKRREFFICTVCKKNVCIHCVIYNNCYDCNFKINYPD